MAFSDPAFLRAYQHEQYRARLFRDCLEFVGRQLGGSAEFQIRIATDLAAWILPRAEAGDADLMATAARRAAAAPPEPPGRG